VVRREEVDARTIGPDLAERVLDRFGFDEPPAVDAAGLDALYRAWGRHVPFDNVRKLIALHSGDTGPLPGLDAADFLETWLRHGTGGTCWPSANALHAFVTACGFDSRLIAASMMDTGEPSHGTTIVTVGSAEWLVDSSMLTDAALPLSPTASTAIDDAVHPTTATPVPEGWLIAFATSVAGGDIACRTLGTSAVDHDFYLARYEVSRTWSPFNEHVDATRNDLDGLTRVSGEGRRRRDATGTTETPLEVDGIRGALVAELGFSEEIVDRLASVLPAF
jgi:N-hydroxyarylamine O-acetyltransferase